MRVEAAEIIAKSRKLHVSTIGEDENAEDKT